MSYKCGSCARVFTSMGGFDRHQDVDYTRFPPVVCLYPPELGMALNKFGRWYEPADAGSRGRLAGLRAAQRAARTRGTPRRPEGAGTL